MRRHEQVEITNTIERLVECRCDLCGKKASGTGFDPYWESSRHSVNETELKVTVRAKDGYSCPDGGAGKEYVVDICPDCFKGRLIPWLESQGAKIDVRDWDF